MTLLILIDLKYGGGIQRHGSHNTKLEFGEMSLGHIIEPHEEVAGANLWAVAAVCFSKC